MSVRSIIKSRRVALTFVVGVGIFSFLFIWQQGTVDGHLSTALAYTGVEVAVVIAYLGVYVEPILRRDLLTHTRDEAYWGLFNPSAPRKYRDALNAEAAEKHHHRMVEWSITFSSVANDEGRLRIVIKSVVRGVSYSDAGYKPDTRLYGFPSKPGYVSRFEYYSITVPSDAWDTDSEFSENDLAGSVEQDRDGSLHLDEGKLLYTNGQRSVPASMEYKRIVVLEIWRSDVDHLFFIQRWPALQVRYVLSGDALPHLSVVLTRPLAGAGRPGIAPLETSSFDGQERVAKEFDLMMAGQGVIVSWAPLRHPTSDTVS